MNPLSALVGRHIESGAREAVTSGPIPSLLKWGARGYGAVSGMQPLDRAALATAPIPVVGDVTGLAADARMFAQEPESRNPLNFGLAALGALPFVPALSTVKRAGDDVWYHGTPTPVRFDAYDRAKFGSSSGAKDALYGVYHAKKSRTAAAYAGDPLEVTQQEMAEYLRDIKANSQFDYEGVKRAIEANNPGLDIDRIERGEFLYSSRNPVIPEGALRADRLDTSNYKVIDMKGRGWDEARQRLVAREADEAGYDGVIFKNMYDAGLDGVDDIALSFRPEKIIGSGP